jgi:hypothetical protein
MSDTTTESPVVTTFLGIVGALVGGGIAVAVSATAPFVVAGAVVGVGVAKMAKTAYDKNYWDGRIESYLDRQTPGDEKQRLKKKMQTEMLATDGGWQALAARPQFGGEVLSAIDPALLDNIDLGAKLGKAKDNVLAEALLQISAKLPSQGQQLNRDLEFDPALFSKLAKQVEPAVWNDKGDGIGAPKRGLGPLVCNSLVKDKRYDQICELIAHGVDTNRAAAADGRFGRGIHADFAQGIQHVAAQSLRDVALLDDGEPLPDDRKAAAVGAKKIFEALEKKGADAKDGPVSLTKWTKVTGSEMITTFKGDPGTIWGFEHLRMPYVQAAHETDRGAQPLRMMELWDAVTEGLSADGYMKLLNDPNAIRDFVDVGEQRIRESVRKKEPNYTDVKDKLEEFIGNFRQDATSFLTEFSAQIPKVTFAKPLVDQHGKTRRDKSKMPLGVSDIAGIGWSNFVSTFACKTGLWWAQQQKKPVYYVLDGVNMNDVTDFKKMKNQSIEEFLAAGGIKASAKRPTQAVTLAEVREILNNWDELKYEVDGQQKDVVKFVMKGEILKGDKLADFVKDNLAKIQESNKAAGRAPAPPRTEFANELNSIDPGLMTNLQDGPEGDKDARDIVRKSGYLVNIAKARPEIVLKYLTSKCDVLMRAEYNKENEIRLVPKDLPRVALQFRDATGDQIEQAKTKLLVEIGKCNAKFQEPLKTALLGLRPQPVAQGEQR